MRYRIIILSVVGLLIIVSLVVFIFGRKPSTTATATLTFWGLDSPNAWSAIIQAYKTKNPTVTINYIQKDSVSYEKDFVNALASGSGPDIVYINNTWTNKHLSKLSPAPASFISTQSFKDSFVDVTAADLIKSGNIYGVSLYVDTLALYYNKSLFNNEGIAGPPRTWDEFNVDAGKLTQRSEDGEIGRAGAALGLASNVNHAADILGLLMLQTGTVMVNAEEGEASFAKSVSSGGRTYSPGQAALDFYTNFANSTRPFYTWNARMPVALSAFTQGKAAMYLGYARDLPTIQKSGINFGLAAAPQVKDTRKDSSYLDVNFASYMAGAVTKSSANKSIAWDFLVYATTKNAANNYLFYTKLPTARKDLVEFQSSDPMMAIFAKQALSAFSWPQPDEAEVANIFKRMIDSVALGQATSADAIKEAAVEVTNLLK